MTCIHIDHDGTTWVNTPEGIPTQVIGKYRPSKLLATTYRVIAVPQNYKVIISLYLALINKEIKGNLLVGSPRICRRYHNSSLQLLNCISVLNPHDNLPHTWHHIDSTSYRNFLLLEVKQSIVMNIGNQSIVKNFTNKMIITVRGSNIWHTMLFMLLEK